MLLKIMLIKFLESCKKNNINNNNNSYTNNSSKSIIKGTKSTKKQKMGSKI